MAGTYYKYAERQADSQVNWFQVGKDMTDMLKKETELREQKKAAIDEASRQFGQELENAPTGNADDVNEWTTNFAADMQEYRLMTDRLLKSGRLNPKNYTLIRQNSLDGTKNLFSLSKEYQAEYEEKMKRKNENISSAAEGQFMAMVEGFANLKQTKPLINPTNGAISVGRMERGPDGVMRLKEGADNYMTVNQLRNRIKEKVDKYKLNEDLQGEVKMMGEVVNEIVMKTGSATETGFLQKITDPTLRKGLAAEGQQAVNTYLKLESDIVKAKLTNPKNVSSVLFDWAGVDPKTGKAYQVVTDPKVAETSSHYVLWTYNDGLFQPDFETTKHGKEQYKQAEEYVKTKLRGMLEQKSELDPFSQPRKEQPPQQQQWQAERSDKLKADRTAGNMIGMLYSGTPEQQQAAVSYFGGLPNVRSVRRTNDGIEVTTLDGVVKPLPFKNPNTGQLMSQNDFVRSASSLLLGKDVNLNEVVRGSLGTGRTSFSQGEAGFSAQTNNPNEMYGNYISTNITPALISKEKDNDKAEKETLKNLKPLLQKIGFEAVIPSTFWTAGKFIEIKGNGKSSGEIDLSNPTNAIEEINSFLVSNVPGATEEEKMMFLSSLAKKGVITPPKPAAAKQQPTAAPVPNSVSQYNKKKGK